MRIPRSKLLTLTGLSVAVVFSLGCATTHSTRQSGLTSPTLNANHTASNTPATLGYIYQYYPSAEVYYDPQREIYFWHASAYWGVGKRLPSTYRLREDERLLVNLDSKRPYRRHEMVLASIANPRSQQAQGLIVSVETSSD